ncbi:group III truncated hemoglobin [Leadbetterella sp. DM7]|uniref:group III truncated hemoglobin n=1 Tax=Leadbetterella sp. DM7 TaxID=3235085 RepID=UPI00349EA55B
MKDIGELADIQLLVDTFYGKIREDDLLKDIFNGIIQDRWPEHLEKMYRFWQTVLLEEHTYFGSPFPPHLRMPVSEEHFNRWVMLFSGTVDGLFEGDKAERAKWQGSRMAEMFLSKITYFRENNLTPLV